MIKDKKTILDVINQINESKRKFETEVNNVIRLASINFQNETGLHITDVTVHFELVNEIGKIRRYIFIECEAKVLFDIDKFKV